MSKKVGLPEFVKSRYDGHLVDEISTRTRTSIIRRIPLARIMPNLLQPRRDFGDLTELIESVKEKGILEPLLVRPHDGKFEIIAGERRFRAAREAGLAEVPCIEYDVPDNEALEISIVENIQRKDLNIYEKAISIKSLCDIYGYTHEEIAKKLGKSRVTVSELIRLTDLPDEIIEMCRESGIYSKSFLLQLVKLGDIKLMKEIINEYKNNPFSREDVKALRKIKSKNKIKQKIRPVKFKFLSEDKKIRIDFRINKNSEEETGNDTINIISILEKLIEDIKEGKIDKLKI